LIQVWNAFQLDPLLCLVTDAISSQGKQAFAIWRRKDGRNVGDLRFHWCDTADNALNHFFVTRGQHAAALQDCKTTLLSGAKGAKMNESPEGKKSKNNDYKQQV